MSRTRSSTLASGTPTKPLVFLALAGVFAVTALVQALRQGWFRDPIEEALLQRRWLVVSVITLAVAGYYLHMGGRWRWTSDEGLYCRYGAASQRQVDTCFRHVGEQDISRRQTNAAQFARGSRETFRRHTVA